MKARPRLPTFSSSSRTRRPPSGRAPGSVGPDRGQDQHRTPGDDGPGQRRKGPGSGRERSHRVRRDGHDPSAQRPVPGAGQVLPAGLPQVPGQDRRSQVRARPDQLPPEQLLHRPSGGGLRPHPLRPDRDPASAGDPVLQHLGHRVPEEGRLRPGTSRAPAAGHQGDRRVGGPSGRRPAQGARRRGAAGHPGSRLSGPVPDRLLRLGPLLRPEGPGRGRGPSIVPEILPSLRDDSDNVRFEAVRALGKLGGAEAVTAPHPHGPQGPVRFHPPRGRPS